MKSCRNYPSGEPEKSLVSAEFQCRISMQDFFQIAPLTPFYPTFFRAHPCRTTTLSLPSTPSLLSSHSTFLAIIVTIMSSQSRYKTAAAILLYQQLRQDADEDYAIANIVLPTIQRGQINSHYARNRKIHRRRSWTTFKDKLTDRQFRLYFRMSKGLFRLLCDEIVGLVGVSEFKSEEFLNEMINSDDPCRRSMMVANVATTGGFISGEIKLAITLRILGGCSPLDMAMLFDTSFGTAYKIFKEVISNWLSHDRFCPIDGVQYCSDDDRMKSVALQFCESSSGIMNGCIGALDGWIVKVQKPLKSDGVNNPQSFYS